MRKIAIAVFLLFLVGCNVARDILPVPTPGPMELRQYLPLVTHHYRAPVGGYGVGGGLWGFDFEWYYHWSVGPPITDRRFVRMVWCLNNSYLVVNLPLIIAGAKADATTDRHTWLVLNEPDISGTIDSCGYFSTLTPETTADLYAEVYTLIKSHDPQAQIFVGGIAGLNSTGSRNWWMRFVTRLKNTNKLHTVEGVHIHAYPCWSAPCDGWGMPELFAALDDWYTSYHVGLGLGDRPIWITEIGAGPFCGRFTPFDPDGWTQMRDNVMLPFKTWYESDANPGYDSAAWFVSWWDGVGLTWWCGFLVDARSLPAQLTPLGEAW